MITSVLRKLNILYIPFKIGALFLIHLLVSCYMNILLSYSHVENTYMTALLYEEWRFGPIKLAEHRHVLLKYIYLSKESERSYIST